MENTKTHSVGFYDTTLRDGAQKANDYPTDEQAALMGAVLADLGINHIEIGVPVSENQSKQRLELIIKAIKETGRNPVLYGFCRCVRNDIDSVLDKMKTAENLGVNIVVSGSELFQILRDSELKNKDWDELTSEEISKMEEKILNSIIKQVSYSKDLFQEVRVCFEDASMGKKEFLLKAIRIAFENGAKVMSIPDTLGEVTPKEMKELFSYLNENTKDLQEKGLKFAVHAHDDRGLAIANTMSAIEAGATSVEGTLIGSGERVGNVNLKDIIGNIATLKNRIIDGEEFKLEDIVVENLYETYKIIYAILGKKRDPYTRFIGEFSTKTQVGIHQSLENKSTEELEEFFKKYSRITPYSFIDTNKFGTPILDFNIYTNLSGFSNLEACLDSYGVKIEKDSKIHKQILEGLIPDLDTTKIVYASRVFWEYLVQSGWAESITNESINLSNENEDMSNEGLTISLNILGKDLVLNGNLTEKDGVLGAAVIAVNNFLAPDYEIDLNEFSLNMHEGVKKVSERFESKLGEIYRKLDIDNGKEQMGISEVEGVVVEKATGERIPFKSTASDLHGNTANIKALLYSCLPLVCEKFHKQITK